MDYLADQLFGQDFPFSRLEAEKAAAALIDGGVENLQVDARCRLHPLVLASSVVCMCRTYMEGLTSCLSLAASAACLKK